MSLSLPTTVDLGALGPLVDRLGGTISVTAEGVVVHLPVLSDQSATLVADTALEGTA